MIRWIMAIIQSADLLPLYALHSQRSETQEKNSPKNPQIHMAPFVLSCPTWLMDSNLFAEWRVYWVTHFLFVLFGFTTSHFLMRLVSYYLVTFLLSFPAFFLTLRPHATWHLALSGRASNMSPYLLLLYLFSFCFIISPCVALNHISYVLSCIFNSSHRLVSPSPVSSNLTQPCPASSRQALLLRHHLFYLLLSDVALRM